MRNTYWLIGTIFILLLSIAACQSSEDLGADILGEDALLNADFTDTLSIQATLLEKKPTDMSLAQLNNLFLVGALNDPVFGQSSANLCMQFSLGTGQNNLRFDSLPVIDSVVLSLAYSPGSIIYGDSSQMQELTIYELQDSLVFTDSDNELVDYESDFVCTLGEEVGNGSYLFSMDSIMVDDSTQIARNALRIRLNDELGQRFLDASVNEEDSTFFNIVTFLEFFKGLAIVPSPNNTAVASFNLASVNTKLSFYYQAYYFANPDSIAYGPRSRDFIVRSVPGVNSLLAVNSFSHNYNGTTPQQLLNDGGSISDMAYLQSMAGLEIGLEFPHIEDLGNIIVNRAELIVNNILTGEDEEIFYPAPAIMGFQLSNQNDEFISDGAGEVSVYTDSTATEVIRMNRYTLPMTITLQRLLQEGQNNTNFKIRLVENPLNPFRLEITGPEHPDYPMQLNLFYTQAN